MPVRRVYADSTDDQAEYLIQLQRRVTAAESAIASLQPGPRYWVGKTVSGVTGPAWENSWANDTESFHVAAWFARFGSQARMEFVATTPSVISTNGTTLFTLPVGYRPKRVVQMPIRSSIAVSGWIPFINIQTSGAVQAYMTGVSGGVGGSATVGGSFLWSLHDPPP